MSFYHSHADPIWQDGTFNFLGRVWQPAADNNGWRTSSFKKSAPNGHYYL